MALIYSFGLTDTSFTGGPTGTSWQPHNFLYGGRVTIPSAGTVTQLGVRCISLSGTRSLKLGLYTTAGVLVAQSTGSIGTTAAWADSGTISGSVTAQDYIVLISADTTNVGYYYNTGQNGSFATEVYATAMQATETITLEGDANLGYGVRVDFTASAGSTELPFLTMAPLSPPRRVR